MEEKEIHDDLAAIRGLMERSSKFISLSGLSGILAGIYALIGACLAYRLIYIGPSRIYDSLAMSTYPETLYELIAIAAIVLVLSIATGIILSTRQAKRKGQPMWGKSSRLLLYNMAIPLLAGGAFILIHIYRGHYGLISATSLIFYGLSLVSASNFTFTDVKYLGLCEILLGLIAACLPGYGLLFWALGFGVLHIIYGGMMYLKYDK